MVEDWRRDPTISGGNTNNDKYSVGVYWLAVRYRRLNFLKPATRAHPSLIPAHPPPPSPSPNLSQS